MPKMTAKYSSAVAQANVLSLDVTGDQEQLYAALEKNDLMWDSDQKQWLQLVNEAADEPTELVMVRFWAETERVERYANEIQKHLEQLGCKLVEKSRPYVCRPPKQKESRVYLKVLPSYRWKAKS